MRVITFLLVGTILTVVQVFLSKRVNKRLGLILPIISFGVSILLTITSPYWIAYKIWIAIVIFILTNVPTAVLFGIYLFYRAQKPDLDEISKMSILDLE